MLYNLAQRDIEHAVVPWCEAHGVAVVGYTPFGRAGFPPSGSGGRTLAQIAVRHGATAHQVALAFLTRERSTFAIPKASSAAHVRDNAAAARVTLEPADIAALDAAFPRPRRKPGVPTL